MTGKNQLIHMHKYLCWHVNIGIVCNSYLCKDSVTKKLNCKKISVIKDELNSCHKLKKDSQTLLLCSPTGSRPQ